jgi:hypothetical protein
VPAGVEGAEQAADERAGERIANDDEQIEGLRLHGALAAWGARRAGASRRARPAIWTAGSLGHGLSLPRAVSWREPGRRARSA